jgi:hypothetical protein
MKAFFALSALVVSGLISSAALATTPVRHTQPIEVDPASRAAVRPVLQMTVGMGLVPRGAVQSMKLDLGEDGSVKVTEITADEYGNLYAKSYESLWYFEMDVMAKVEAAAARLQQPAKLVDQNPKDPTYADGLSISVSVIKGGKKLVVARSSGGHNFLPAHSSQTRAAKYLLNDMTNLFRAINADRR